MGPTFSLNDLKDALCACAGETRWANLEGDIADQTFDDLGYDSLAMIETATYLSHHLGVDLPEEALADSKTPRHFIQLVNDHLGAHAAAGSESARQ